MSEALIREYYDAINDRDYPKIKGLITADFTYHQKGAPDRVGYEDTIEKGLKPYIENTPAQFVITKLYEKDGFNWVHSELVPQEDNEPMVDKILVEDSKIASQWTIANEDQ